MDGVLTFGPLTDVMKHFGPYGLLLVIWWLDSRRFDKTMIEHRRYMDEIRSMYESNVKLVENYESVSGDLKDLVVLNTQSNTLLSENINKNQYCPMIRIEKQEVTIPK